jgi:hypothetical protein
MMSENGNRRGISNDVESSTMIEKDDNELEET